MLLLIDAYNLLHQSDALGRRREEGWLQRARERLAANLAKHLGSPLVAETCLVFDAQSPPPGLPSHYRIAGIEVLFAVNHDEADDLLEDLIAKHPTPKRLTVVSSDHRVQRAARRRGAFWMDAGPWYDVLRERGPRLAIPWPPGDPSGERRDDGNTGRLGDLGDLGKPALPSDPAETERWLAWFGAGGEADGLAGEEGEREASEDSDIIENPFPEGYGEDLLDDL